MAISYTRYAACTGCGVGASVSCINAMGYPKKRPCSVRLAIAETETRCLEPYVLRRGVTVFCADRRGHYRVNGSQCWAIDARTGERVSW